VSAARQYENYYEYDPVGNRTYEARGAQQTYYEYDAGNELTGTHEISADAWTYFQYDPRGNCTAIQETDGTTYFEYSPANLVTAIPYKDGTPDYFHYDGQLARYCIEDSAGCKYYYWDGLDLLARTNLTSGESRTFVHGGTPIPGIGNMVDYSQDGATHTFHYDHRGTVYGITDGSQDVSQTYEHDAWGVRLSATGSLENPIQYQGCAWLRSLDIPGMDWSHLRGYHTYAAAFAQRDRSRSDVLHPYAYTRGNPVSAYDPTGNASTPVVDAFSWRQFLIELWKADKKKAFEEAIKLEPTTIAAGLAICLTKKHIQRALAKVYNWGRTFIDMCCHRIPLACEGVKELKYNASLKRDEDGFGGVITVAHEATYFANDAKAAIVSCLIGAIPVVGGDPILGGGLSSLYDASTGGGVRALEGRKEYRYTCTCEKGVKLIAFTIHNISRMTVRIPPKSRLIGYEQDGTPILVVETSERWETQEYDEFVDAGACRRPKRLAEGIFRSCCKDWDDPGGKMGKRRKPT